jgi:photosystem II stability/assembly factor-like uncharacterized protein
VLFADGALSNTLYLQGSIWQSYALLASNDAGATWSQRLLPQPAGCMLKFVRPGLAGHLFAQCGTSVLYRSRDGGLSWQQLSVTGRQLFVGYANPGRIYLEKYKDLWASDDEGDTWRPVWNVPGARKQFVPILVRP